VLTEQTLMLLSGAVLFLGSGAFLVFRAKRHQEELKPGSGLFDGYVRGKGYLRSARAMGVICILIGLMLFWLLFA
jgi:hypothetical protein